MLDEFVDKLKVISEKTRIRMLNLISQRELCVCEIMQILNINQSNASNHLNMIRLNGFLKVTKRGKWSYYSINSANEVLIKDLLKLIEHIQNDEVIIKDNERLKALNSNICGTYVDF